MSTETEVQNTGLQAVLTADAIEIPGVSLGEDFLSLAEGVTDDHIKGCYVFLRNLGRRLGWWVGDFLVGIEQLRGSDRLKIVMEEWGVSERYAYAGLRVCRLIPRNLRVPHASFELHQAAVDEAPSVEAAVAWVKRAVADGLNASELRAAIRESVKNVNGRQANRAKGPRQYAPLYKAVSAVQRLRIDDLPEVDRSTLRADTEELWQWLNRLHSEADDTCLDVATGPSSGGATLVR